ncbi:MAG: cytochrome c biogenesis protein ResB [Actinobacteria bacterium]|nr:cytochrome c biogenesis protein ResB [Actinomycetota bacterium]
MIRILQKAWKFAQSRKLAVWLLIILGALVGLSRIIPQRSTDQAFYKTWGSAHPFLTRLLERTDLTSIYSSWFFIALCAALFVNTAVCTVQRVSDLFAARGRKAELKLNEIRSLKSCFEFFQPGSDVKPVVAKVVGFLRKRGYKVVPARSPDGVGIFATRGRLARWGGPLFHSALLLIFLGGAIAGLTRFSGVVELTEGQSIVEEETSYVKRLEQGPLFNSADHRGFGIKLVKFKPVYLATEETKNFYSTLMVGDGWESQQMDTYVSQPVTYKGVIIYQNQVNGVSALLTVTDEQGRTINSTFVSFDKPHGIGNPLTGKYEPQEAGISIEGKLYPNSDWRIGGGSPAWEIRKPVLDLKVLQDKPIVKDKKVIRKEKKVVYAGHLALGQVAKFDKLQFKFEDVKYWSSYRIVMDRGQPIIFAGFWLGLFSLGLLSLLNEKRISIIIRTGDGMVGVSGAGTADKYRASFAEELQILVEELEVALGVEKVEER